MNELMNALYTIYIYLDAFLIYSFRLFDIPILGYFTGIFVLALTAVIIGQFTYSIAWRANRKWLGKDSRNMIKMHNLSLKALALKNKGAYTACNKQANEAFGKFFFSQMATGMAALWPAAFALAWLDTRFAGVDFLLPGSARSVGYTATFIPAFILMYMVFGKIKPSLPYFGAFHKKVLEEAEASGEAMALSDIAAPAKSNG